MHFFFKPYSSIKCKGFEQTLTSLLYFICCPTEVLTFLRFVCGFFFPCILMFNSSLWQSGGTIIRYPQREIEKLIILIILHMLCSLRNVTCLRIKYAIRRAEQTACAQNNCINIAIKRLFTSAAFHHHAC